MSSRIRTDATHRREESRQTDGKFGHQQHTESSVVQLRPDSSTVPFYSGPGGSFYYPRPVDNAADAVAFWSTVEIPDEAIYTFHHAVNSAIRARHDDLVDRYNSELIAPWDRQNPKPSDDQDAALWQSRRERHFAELKTEHPDPPLPETVGHDLVDDFEIQQLLRVSKMVNSGVDRNRYPEEHRKVLDTMVERPDGTTSTVGGIYHQYRLGPLAPDARYTAVQSRQSNMLSESIRRGVSRGNEAVAGLLQSVAGNSSGTHQAARQISADLIDIKYGRHSES